MPLSADLELQIAVTVAKKDTLNMLFFILSNYFLQV